MDKQRRKIQNNLNRLRRKLIVLPKSLMIDDSYNDEREGQNIGHSYVFHIIKEVEKELETIKIPGVKDEELDEARNNICSSTLLVEEYDQIMEYIDYLERKIKETEGERDKET